MNKLKLFKLLSSAALLTILTIAQASGETATPVYNVDVPALRPYQASAQSSNRFEASFPAPPFGKRLVIEHVCVEANLYKDSEFTSLLCALHTTGPTTAGSVPLGAFKQLQVSLPPIPDSGHA